MEKARYDFEAVCIKGDVYVFGGTDFNFNIVSSVEKYSPVTNTWKYVADMMDYREHFSACSLMDNVYVIGGFKSDNLDWHNTATCFDFSTKSLKCKEISNLNNARRFSASSIFEGRIVVSGGCYNFDEINTVEVYDHVGDTWENMPSMINERSGHKSIAVKNKLFVIGGSFDNNYEVFDSNTKTFTLLKESMQDTGLTPSGVITIGSKIFMFHNEGEMIVYDFENDEWSEKTCEATKNLSSFSCVRTPILSMILPDINDPEFEIYPIC